MIRLRCGEDVRQAEVRPVPEGWRVTLDGTAYVLEVEPIGHGAFVLRQRGRQRPFYCVREAGRIHLFWQGEAYVLEEVLETERTVHRHQAHGLEAPMPGRVIAIKAEPGQAVSRGDELLVVEAMKMENAVRAPRDGVVKSIAARVGDMVGPGMVLVELE